MVKHKYISKHKSKSGKWVYVYADDIKDKLKGLNDKYGPKVDTHIVAGGRELKYPNGGYDQKDTTIRKNLIGGRTVAKFSAYKKSGRPSTPPEWQASKKDKNRTAWRSLQGTKKDKEKAFAGYDKKRLSMYKDSDGAYKLRTEYGESKYDSERNRKIAKENAASRGNSFMKKIGSLNDKYGPKFVEEESHSLSNGHVYVTSYVRNIIGGKKVRVESYTYDVSK